MVEGDWHENVRNKMIKKYSLEGYQVKNSHEEGKILLYKSGIYGEEPHRDNTLSEVDLVLIKDGKIVELIEIQQSLKPKEIIGIIGSTNLSDKCQIGDKEYTLSNVVLKIIVKKQKEKSRKNNQLNLIKDNLQIQDGCLSNFKFEEHD